MMTSFGLSILLLTMIASFIGCFIGEYRRGSIFIMYAMGLCLLMMPVIGHDLWVVMGDPARPEYEMMIKVALFVTLFNSLYILFRDATAVVVFPRILQPTAWQDPAQGKKTLLFLWLILPLMVFLMFASFGFSFQGLMTASWIEAHNDDDGRIANVLLSLLLCLSPGAITYLAIQKQKKSAIVYGAFLLILIVMERSRGAMLGLMSNIAFIMLLHFKNAAHKRRLLVWYLLVGFSFVLLFVGIQVVRYAGAFSNLATYVTPENVMPLLEKRLFSRDSEVHIIDYFYNIIGYQTYVTGQGTYSNLMRMLFVWDLTHILKGTEDMPKELWEAYKLADLKPREGSLHPTVYGVAWLDGAWGGLIYAPFLATLFSSMEWIAYRLERMHPCWYFALGAMGYLSAFTARGSVYMAFWTCLSGMILSFILVYSLSKLTKSP